MKKNLKSAHFPASCPPGEFSWGNFLKDQTSQRKIDDFYL